MIAAEAMSNTCMPPPPVTPVLVIPPRHRFVRTQERTEDDDAGMSQSSNRSQAAGPERKLVDVSMLTNEQRLVASAHVEIGQTLKVVAYAGTGKTVTLRAFAQMHPEFKILYVAVSPTRVQFPRQHREGGGDLEISSYHTASVVFFSAKYCW